MSERLAHEIDAAWAALEDENYDEAASKLAALEREAPREPGVVLLSAELASVRGESERAVELFLQAAELEPDWPDPLLSAADEALGLGSPDRALEIAERVIDDSRFSDEARVDALLIAAAALLDGGDPEDARVRLNKIEELDPESVEQRHALAELWADFDPERAEAVYRDLVDDDPEDTDALWGVGFCSQQRDVDPSTVWLEVRRRDLEAPAPALALSPEELEQIAERTLSELPEAVRERLRDVPILIDEVPSEELVRDGVDPRLLGLFTGTPLPEKSSMEGQSTAPDAAYLFLRNLANACQSREELAEQVRITILHETAHFFGLEDDDLEALGLG